MCKASPRNCPLGSGLALEDEREIIAPVRREAVQKSATNREGIHLTNTDNIEKKLDSLQTLLENRLQNAPEPVKEEKPKEPVAEATPENVQKKPEMQEEKSMESKEQDKFIRLLYNTMIDNGVDEKYANQLMEDIEKIFDLEITH